MRKSLVALAFVILLAGIAGGVWLGQRGEIHHLPIADVQSSAPNTAAPGERAPATEGEAAARPSRESGGGPHENGSSSPQSASQGRSDYEPQGYAAPAPASTSPSVAGGFVSTGGSSRGGSVDAPGGGAPGSSARGTGFPDARGSAQPAGGAPGVIPPGVAPLGRTVGETPRPTPPPAASPSPSPSDDPESDRKPPVLQYLRFDPPNVQDGGVSVLTIATSDDLSGVKSVFGTMRSPSETAVIPFVGQDPAGSGVFTVGITIPKKGETGNWFVGTLQILDKADNPLYVAYTKANVPPGGMLRVDSAESDSTAPTIRSVTVAKQTVSGGEKNLVIVDVVDDQSGVAAVNGTFQNKSKSAYIPFVTAAAPDGTWTGDLAVPTNADCGEWSLRQVRAVDKANNAIVLAGGGQELGQVIFYVAGGGGCDSDPPVLDGLILSPNEVPNNVASTINVTISAHDDGSGIAQLTGRVEGPPSTSGQVPRIFFSATPDPKNPDAPLLAKINVPIHAGAGIWRVTVIELTDKARNTKTYGTGDPVLANAFFTVD